MRDHAPVSLGLPKLAVEGGAPTRTAPFAPWPHYSEADVKAASGVLLSGRVNYWTGDEGRQFEQEFARYCGTKHAVAVANGSVALELALYALGIGPGDEVVTPCRSYIASASSIVLRGATPVFADIDAVTQTVTAEALRAVLTPRTRALLVVHLAGWPCPMDDILQLAREHDLRVIEDCAQAHGSQYRGRPVGSFGDIAAFSFCQDKIITTGGEGGMVVTNSDDLWQRAWSYKDHGKSYAAVYERAHQPGFRWLHESVGSNWRLTEMQSAIGRVQLRVVDRQVEERNQLAARLNEGFSRMPALRRAVPPELVRHAYYRYYVWIRPEKLRPGWSRDRVLTAVNREGIPCFTGSCSEIYMEKAFENMRPPARLAVGKELGETGLAFLVHPTLSEADMQDTVAAVGKVLCHAVEA